VTPMNSFGLPAIYAVLVWWFTTGIILFLDGLPQPTYRWSMIVATAILMPALYVLHLSSADTSTRSAYTAFTCAILVWGWLEMSFLMGFITGSRRDPCAQHCSGWRHFVHGAQAVIYNEIATLVGAGFVLAAVWAGPNRVALWTYLILWVMRISAKLNLFLGVPNLGEKYLPAHLHYLKSFFRRRAMNGLFPFSVGASTIVTVVLTRKYLAAEDAFQCTAYALLTSLLALAVLEHWFMVIPLPSEKLWNWAFKRECAPAAPVNSAKTC
jgi:putative photosynthetic complex assembly protein 2